MVGAQGVPLSNTINDLEWQRTLSAAIDPKRQFGALATSNEAKTALPMIAETSLPRKEVGAAASTLRAADYLVRQNDPARFKAWMAKHNATERAAIIKHLHRAKP
jgi:uncharacterized membrane protein